MDGQLFKNWEKDGQLSNLSQNSALNSVEIEDEYHVLLFKRCDIFI